MKRIITVLLALSIHYSASSQANPSTQDSIATFYNALISVLKTDFLYKDQIQWDTINLELNNALMQYSDFNHSLNEIPTLFDKIKANHCTVYFEEQEYTAPYSGPTGADFSPQWIKKYSTEPKFEVSVLNKKYGYILIPSMNFEDISSENIHRIAQPLYDQINTVKRSHSLKGWIIDLRFNSGGNIYPMLLALYDFLGNTAVYGTMDINKQVTSMTTLKRGKYYDNDTLISYITPKGKKLTQTKVALITGRITASSGEITAMAFKGRKNTCFIGTPTMGMTTTNDKRTLPFGAYMALTIGYDCDRNGTFYQHILPDIQTSKADNFDNPMQDQNIQQAIEFINKK